MMLKKEKINAYQFTLLIIMFSLGGTILLTPSISVYFAKQDAWIAGLLSIIISVFLILLYVKLSSRYPNLNLFEICDHILGRWVGNFFSILFLLYIFLLTITLLEDLGNFLSIQVMANTPKEIFYVTFLALAVFAIYSGIEPVARSAEILFPFLLFLYVITSLLLIPEMDLHELAPVLEFGIKPILFSSYNFLSFPFLQLFIFMVFIPNLNHPQKAKKVFLIGMIIGGILVVLETFYSLTILGVDLTIRNVHPSYLLAKKISVSDFFQRIEVVISFIWGISLYIKTSICFYAFIIGCGHLFRLKGTRSFILPFSILLLSLTVIFTPDYMTYNEFNKKIWATLTWIIGFILPLFLLIISTIRKKSKGPKVHN